MACSFLLCMYHNRDTLPHLSYIIGVQTIVKRPRLTCKPWASLDSVQMTVSASQPRCSRIKMRSPSIQKDSLTSRPCMTSSAVKKDQGRQQEHLSADAGPPCHHGAASREHRGLSKPLYVRTVET